MMRNASNISNIGTLPCISFFLTNLSQWNGLFLKQLRHIVKTKTDSMPKCMNFRLGDPIGLEHSLRQRYDQNNTKFR